MGRFLFSLLNCLLTRKVQGKIFESMFTLVSRDLGRSLSRLMVINSFSKMQMVMDT